MSIKSSPEFTPIVESLGKPLTGQHPYTLGWCMNAGVMQVGVQVGP